MIKITLNSYKDISIEQDEKVYVGENNISKIDLFFPDKINAYSISECRIEMRSYLSEDKYISQVFDNPSSSVSVPVTIDYTDEVRVIKIMLIITNYDGNVIGKTNKVRLKISPTGEGGTPIDPREELDEIIAEQRAEIAEQAETIETQGETITQQGEQITELNGEVTELQGEVAEQAATITRQNTTIDELNRRVPPLETLDPINPSQTQQTFNPESPNIGFPQVIVNAPTAEGLGFREDFYKKDEHFLNKVGTYDPFPEHSVGGIYITEVDELTNPKSVILYGEQMKNCNNNVVNTIINSTYIEKFVFKNCPNIKSINMFYDFCPSIRELILSEGLEYIKGYFMYAKTTLKKIYLPSTLLGFVDSGVPNVFYGCNNLEFVILGNGFNCNNLNLSSSTRYSHDTILSWFNALADRTGQTAYTLTMGTTNLNKLTAEQKAIATNKNWNLA